MHVKPDDRQRAIQTLLSLLKPAGVVYITLRIGPPEPARGIYLVSEAEVMNIATALGLSAKKLDEQIDLLGRSNIRWVSMEISKQ